MRQDSRGEREGGEKVSLPDIGSYPGLKDVIARALKEDIGSGDITSAALVGEQDGARARIVSRGDYILSGIPVALQVFSMVEPSLVIRSEKLDGQPVRPGECVLEVGGKARGILAGERVALNFLQRMTGIASLTRQFVDKAKPYGVQILDTRKTTPGLRALEKYAVLCGGGVNHRMGLYDRILIKDNHRAFWRNKGGGSLADAVQAARLKCPGVPVEIEVETVDEMVEVIDAAPDWVLLDNMTEHSIRNSVQAAEERCKIELSGGVTLETVEQLAKTGINAISVGALTHSAPAADFSLEFSE